MIVKKCNNFLEEKRQRAQGLEKEERLRQHYAVLHCCFSVYAKKLYIQKKKVLSEGYMFEDILTKLELRKSFPKSKLKLNSRAIRAFGLLKPLQNHQKRNKDFMKNS